MRKLNLIQRQRAKMAHRGNRWYDKIILVGCLAFEVCETFPKTCSTIILLLSIWAPFIIHGFIGVPLGEFWYFLPLLFTYMMGIGLAIRFMSIAFEE